MNAGLLTVIGKAGEGGFGAWGKDIEEREKYARDLNLEDVKQKAWAKRQENLLRLESQLEEGQAITKFTREQGAEETRYGRRKAEEETTYKRRKEEEETTYKRQLQEKLAMEKQILQVKAEAAKDTEDLKLIKEQSAVIKEQREFINEKMGDITPADLAQMNEQRRIVGLDPLEFQETGEFTESGGFFGLGKTRAPVMGLYPTTGKPGLLSGGGTPITAPSAKGEGSSLDELIKKVKEQGGEEPGKPATELKSGQAKVEGPENLTVSEAATALAQVLRKAQKPATGEQIQKALQQYAKEGIIDKESFVAAARELGAFGKWVWEDTVGAIKDIGGLRILGTARFRD